MMKPIFHINYYKLSSTQDTQVPKIRKAFFANGSSAKILKKSIV